MKDILIVEDVSETRHWLSRLVSKAFPGCKIVLAESVRAGTAAVARTKFDLALIDLGLPDGNGLELLRKVSRLHPETLCVIATVMGDDAYIVSALSCGASGYLLKEQEPDRLINQLRQLAHGIPALSPSIARRIMDHFKNTGPVAGQEHDLTLREQEVLGFISRGLRNADVAAQLGLSESTVATHLKSIYRKLGISSRAEASWHATRLGLGPGKTE